MGRILWLADVLRGAGVDVVEEAGWRTRGRDDFEPFGLIAHATAGGLLQSNDSAVSTIINGRPGLSGPIGQAMIERGTGRWRIVASGAGNHAKTGWAGPLAGHGNRTLIGVECHHNNLDEPWSDAVYRSYVAGFGAICRHLGWDPLERIAGHKEHQPGEKSDPTFNLSTFRAQVRDWIATGGDMPDFTPADLNAWAQALRVEALRLGQGTGPANPLPVAAGGGVMWINEQVAAIKADVAELKSRPAVQPAPIDAATLKAALLDPEVAAALVEAARQGAEAAEDS